MTGLFGTLNTSTSGMRAQQAALQTTSHNLANSNTLGYSRQRVTMTANLPQSLAGIGQIGTGVLIGGITRITDDFVTMQLQNEQASLTRYQQKSEILAQLEAAFNEPSTTGVSHQMSELFGAWSNVASNPESLTSKTMVVRQSETFLDTINHAQNKMTSLEGETVELIKKDVLDFNSAAEQLKTINDQIFNATVKGERPNDLLDKQDLLVGQMKDIAGVSVDKDKYGRAFISLGEQPVVTESEVNEIKLTDEVDGEISVLIGEDKNPVSVEVNTGSIKGLQEALVVVKEKHAELSTFVENITDKINTIHMTDTDGNKVGIPFFIEDENGFKVNPELIKDPSNLNVGKEIVNDGISGDGSRAKAIFDLQQTLLGGESTYNAEEMKFTNSEDGSTLFTQYNTIVTNMGIEKQQADNMVANQTDLTTLLEQRRDSISGVDINEEVVNMIQSQSAYQANARAISVISDMLDTLINRMGV